MGSATLALLGTVACVLLSGVAAAQTSAPDPVAAIIQKNRVLPGFRQALQANFTKYESGLTTHCDKVELDWDAAHTQVLQRGTVLPSGQADGTVWEESVPGHACGESRDYRALIVLRAGGGQIQPLLPGDGWAGPLLERDTMVQVAAAAAIYTHDRCPVDVIRTHLTEGKPSTNPKAPWTELWTVRSCGKQFGLPVTFTPDESGGGTSMSVNATKAVPLP